MGVLWIYLLWNNFLKYEYFRWIEKKMNFCNIKGKCINEIIKFFLNWDYRLYYSIFSLKKKKVIY